MKNRSIKPLTAGAVLIAAFAAWTALITTVDVRPIGPDGTRVGLAALNAAFHSLTGVHMSLYAVTDWLGLVPVAVCLIFAALGLVQLIGRRSVFNVDGDILLLGVYYIALFFGYLIFETFPINCRPILIEGRLEASYPSSTTLLVLGVMPTLGFEARLRLKNEKAVFAVRAFSAAFSLFMVAGRTVSGVHWLTDIIGSVILSAGLYLMYLAAVAAVGGTRKTEA